MSNEKNQVRAHGELFSLEILNFKKLKSSPAADLQKIDVYNDGVETAADSNFTEVNCEVVSIDQILEEYALDSEAEGNASIGDQNSRDISKFKSLSKDQKHQIYLKKKEREKHFLVKLYLSPDLQEYARRVGGEARKNASVGSGVAKIVKNYISMKKRENLLVGKIQHLIVHLNNLTEELAVLKMKNGTLDEITKQNEKILTFSKDVCHYIDLFGFTLREISELLPPFLVPTLEYAFNKVTNDIREKQLIKKYAN